MNKTLFDLLSYPFEKELTAPLDIEARALFIQCAPSGILSDIKDKSALIYDAALALKTGCKTVQLLGEEKYDLIFCVLPKNKTESQYFIALAAKNLAPLGQVVFVAANDAGGKMLVEWLKNFGFTGDDYSKSKARIFVGRLSDPQQDSIEHAYQAGCVRNIEMQGHIYQTQPGIFGWQKIDQGSRLLVESIDCSLSGEGADFGCGYGYLSREILSKPNRIQKLHLIDIDWRAVDCANRNLEQYDSLIELHWADCARQKLFDHQLDWIVMNPPFHEGKAEDKNLGTQMIIKAFEALKKKGVLYMVANRHLPYEKSLNSFSSFEKIKEESGFKVFKAIK